MSKAEDRYIECFLFDINLRRCDSKDAFIKGYNQAEKDLELGWKDIKAIDKLILYVDRKYSFNNDDELYKEVLKRFKAQRDENTD